MTMGHTRQESLGWSTTPKRAIADLARRERRRRNRGVRLIRAWGFQLGSKAMAQRLIDLGMLVIAIMGAAILVLCAASLIPVGWGLR
jgi:hypothetical protein